MFWDNFERLSREKGMKPTPAAAEIGFPSASVVKWKKGTIPRGTTLQKIADYFNVTVNDLLSDPAEAPPPSKLHREEGVRIPILASVKAGIPENMILEFEPDSPDSWEEITEDEAMQGEYFAFRIRGNSMTPIIRHGDVVIVRMQKEFEDGDVVIAAVNGDEVVCKRLEYRENGIALRSDNPEYQPLIFTQEEVESQVVKLIGKCVERRGKL